MDEEAKLCLLGVISCIYLLASGDPGARLCQCVGRQLHAAEAQDETLMGAMMGGHGGS